MIFKKKLFTVECLDNGQIVFNININKKTNVKHASELFNHLMTRQYMEDIINAIIDSGNKNHTNEKAEEICNNILSFQSQILIKPITKTNRNPIIKPSMVMKKINQEDAND